MSAHRTTSAFILSLVLLLVGCDVFNGSSEDEPRALTSQEKTIVEAETNFGLELFRSVVTTEETDSNVFISPLSVSMALGMTMNGAADSTYDAMRQTLGMEGLSESEVNEAYRDLIDLLTHLDSKVAFRIANSVWHREEFDVEEAFLEKNREHFDAKVDALDFDSPESVDTINAWVEENTEGHIEEIVTPPIDRLTMMYLVNAIYFQGDWRQQFDPDETEEKPFTRADGSIVQVDMMHQTTDWKYLRTERMQAVDLAYGDSLFSMTVVLPHEEVDVNALIEGLTADTWNDWTGDLETQEVALEMPKFELAYEKPLAAVLADLGMGIAFEPLAADFSRINPNYEDLHISEVQHKTFLKVDEEGTEASASTSVGVSATSGPVSVHLDRPFLLAIREHHSDTLLFLGKVMDPTG